MTTQVAASPHLILVEYAYHMKQLGAIWLGNKEVCATNNRVSLKTTNRKVVIQA